MRSEIEVNNMSFIQLKQFKETKADIRPLDKNKRKQGEAVSGMNLKNVEVHYHSDLPEQLKCDGLTFGNKIALSPNKEAYLDHELGHVIQQKQGRVPIQSHAYNSEWNFQNTLESEATSLGDKMNQIHTTHNQNMPLKNLQIQHPILQPKPWDPIEFGEFILDEHHNAIERKYNCRSVVISFRRAGKDTLERMKFGSGHKGHAVMEKSIKDKTITALIERHNPEDTESISKENLEKLRGLIGRWENQGSKLSGVYLSDRGYHTLQDESEVLKYLSEKGLSEAEYKPILNALKTKIEILGEGKEQAYYIRLEDTRLFDLLDIDNESGKKLSPLFLTGDYDIHDIGWSNTHMYIPYKISEHRFLSELDHIVRAESNDNRTDVDFQEDDMSYIRHGAQANYPAFVKEHIEEQGKKMPYAVINADPDLLFYFGYGEGVYQGWYHTSTMEELKTYYEHIGKAMPEHYGNTREAHKAQAGIRYDNLEIEKLIEKIRDKKERLTQMAAMQRQNSEKINTYVQSLNSQDIARFGKYKLIETLLKMKDFTMKDKWK